jgi:membrane protease YdiL (CAAX protease family)
MSLANVLRKKPVISFFILAFIISWAIWTPLVIYYYSSPFEVSFSTVPVVLIIFAFLGFFGPTIAGLIMARVADGRGGIKKLLSGWKFWRTSIFWYLGILACRLLLDVVSYSLSVSLFNLDVTLDWSRWSLILPAFGQAALIGGAIAEETGWRGFALPRLMKSRSALFSALIIGVLWGLWHLPLCLIPGANFPTATTPELFLVYVAKVICFSVIISWIYVNTKGNIFACYLFHALLNTALTGNIVRFADQQSGWWVQMCVSAVIFALAAIGLVVFFGRSRLTRQTENTIAE